MDAWDETVKLVLSYYSNHPDEFNESIEWVDDEMGWLESSRRFPMEDIDDWLSNTDVKTIMQMALNGWDADGGGDFDPDREYYYRDYWDGHLLSTDSLA